MKNRHTLQKRIDSWIRKNKVYDKDITKNILSKILGIKKAEITDIEVRCCCANVFTQKFVYKIQLYGDSIIRDLKNRKLFALYDKDLLCPIRIKHRKPLIVVMPRLTEITAYDEAAYFVLERLKEYGCDTVFKIEDYPLVVYGLNILKCCPEGIELRKTLYHYLRGKEGTVLRTGPVHGDFHRGNIMAANGKLLLIDFDSFKDNGVQAVDALYFILEEVRYKGGHRKSWLEEWLYLYKNIKEIQHEYKCIKQVDIDLQLGLILLLLEWLVLQQQHEEKFIIIQKDSIRRINRTIERLYG